MSPRDLRALLIGGMVIGLAWVTTRGAPRAVQWIAMLEDEADQRSMVLSRARSETDGLRALSDSIARLEEVAKSLPRVLLAGGDPGTAAFDLTRRLSLLLSRSPAWVDAIHPTPDSTRSGPVSRAAVQVTLETDVMGLMAIVRRIEEDSSMAVEMLDVRAFDPLAAASEVERLAVRFTVSGWFRPDADPTPAEGPGKEANPS